MRYRQPFVSSQHGSALVIGLLFLVVLTLMATTALMAATSQERTAAAQRQSTMALLGADAAARAGERWLYDFYLRAYGESLIGTMAGEDGLFTPAALFEDPMLVAFVEQSRWIADRGVQVDQAFADFAGAPASAKLVEQPRYLIEDLGVLRPGGVSSTRELGVTGGAGYASWITPGGNEDLRIYKITAKSRGASGTLARTVTSTFAGRAKG